MRHLTAAETKCDLDSVSLGEELSGSVDLGRKVICIDIGRKPDLLDLYDVLLALGILLFTRLLVFIFSVVDNFAYGRFRIRGNLPSAEMTRTSLSRILSLMNKSSLSLSLLFTFIASSRPGAKKTVVQSPLSHACLFLPRSMRSVRNP